MYRNAVRGNVHKNLVRFGRVVFELRERTDRQTYTVITIHYALVPGTKQQI